MPLYLGVDTSNYATSAALYDPETSFVQMKKQFLPVKPGALGLQQSEAVFLHTKQLPLLLEELLREAGELSGIGVSTRPRCAAGSYMPCFLAGEAAARAAAAAAHCRVYPFSHQQGHVAAALYSSGRMDLFQRKFLVFHVSGGTTEALLAEPGKEDILRLTPVARSLDLKAGQALDRIGVMLGFPFPAGAEVDKLALAFDQPIKVRPSMKGADCSLSGVENQCRKLLSEGAPPARIARHCMESVLAALRGMAYALKEQYGDIPLIFAGGVMSSRVLRGALETEFEAGFAEPQFSSDNAFGAALLAFIKANES